MKPFRFQNQVIYERIQIFVNDIYGFTGALPVYEKSGLIAHLRSLATSLLETYAEGSVRTARTDPNQAIDKCVVTIAKIVAVIDLCLRLRYTSESAHSTWVNSCDELTKNLYTVKRSLEKQPN